LTCNVLKLYVHLDGGWELAVSGVLKNGSLDGRNKKFL
jgi:hypothetical protein